MAADRERRKPGQLHITTSDDGVIIDVQGILDETAARTIGAAADGAVGCDGGRVRVELGSVVGSTPRGVVAFAALRSGLSPEARRWVTFHAGSAAGQEVLFATQARAT